MIDVVFDGPPGPVAGRFVEVERDGRSIAIGEWRSRPDGYWVLRLPAGPSRDDIRPALDPGVALEEAQAIAGSRPRSGWPTWAGSPPERIDAKEPIS